MVAKKVECSRESEGFQGLNYSAARLLADAGKDFAVLPDDCEVN